MRPPRTDALAAAYPGAAIYRFIPNMPVEVRRGVLCYVPGPGAENGPEAEILELMRRVGEVIRLDDEPLIEPAMALMSCGPAFMALVAESFADAGAAHGLDPDDALRMVVETMGGTAEYLAQHGYDAAGLRARVATPGGTTEQGLIRLEEDGLRQLVRAAVDGVVEATRMSTFLLAVTRGDVADYVRTLALVYLVLIFIRIILSWIPRMPYNRGLNGFLKFVTDVTDPYLNLFRRILPPVRIGPGALDLSPIIATFALIIVSSLVAGLIEG